jgi:hypothetical protein
MRGDEHEQVSSYYLEQANMQHCAIWFAVAWLAWHVCSSFGLL